MNMHHDEAVAAVVAAENEYLTVLPNPTSAGVGVDITRSLYCTPIGEIDAWTLGYLDAPLLNTESIESLVSLETFSQELELHNERATRSDADSLNVLQPLEVHVLQEHHDTNLDEGTLEASAGLACCDIAVSCWPWGHAAEIENWKRPSDPLCPTQPVRKKARTCSPAKPDAADTNIETTNVQKGPPTCYTPVMKTRHAVQLVCLLLNAVGLSKSNHRKEEELRKWLESSFPGLVLETRKVKKKKGVDFAYNEHALYGLEGHEVVHRILVFVREQVALVGAMLPDVPSAELFRTEGEYYATLPDGKKLTVTDDMRAKLTGVLGYDPGSLPSPLSAASIHEWRWTLRA
ncbi:hypothetical protein NFJ02_04g118330 [Pycnococcus provasolii]